MNTSLFDRARAERFAQLLDDATGGRHHRARTHSRTRSHLDGDLAELVDTGRKLRAMPVSAAPDPIFKRDLRAMLIATAERDGIGDTAIPEKRPSLRRILASKRARRPRARSAIIIGIAAGTLALSGVSVASGEALPGDPLYGMKRSTERAQLALAGSEFSRGQLHLDFARTRLQEAYALRANESGFVGALGEMDTDTRNGIRMLFAHAIERHDTTALDAVDSFVATQRTLVAQMLDLNGPTGRQKVTGSLAVLTTIEQRAVAARTALACGASPSGADEYGPVLGGCALGAQTSTGTGAKATGQENKTAQTAAGPTGVPQSTSQPAPSGSPGPENKADGGLLGELGRILGGLLGG